MSMRVVRRGPWWFSAAGVIKTLNSVVQGAGQTWARTATAVSYVVLLTDMIIGVTSTAAARTITLPSAVTAGAGARFIVKDESGACSVNNITVTATAGNIDGVASVVMNVNYQALEFYSDGANWFVI